MLMTFSPCLTKGNLRLNLQVLNSRQNNIKFTIEFEESGKIPFLNILVKRCPYNALMTFIYRKKTLTSLYTKWTHSRLANISSISSGPSLIVAPEFVLTSLLQFALSALLKLVPQNGHPLGTITYVTTASVKRNSFPQFCFTKAYNYECFMRS